MSLEGEIILENVRVIPHFQNPAAMCLAKEEALLLNAIGEVRKTGKFEPVVGVYSFENPSVILGNGQLISEVDIDYCSENNIDITKRKSGGGSVYLTPEEIQYFLILPLSYSRPIVGKINSRIQAGLSDVGFSPQLSLIQGYHTLRIDRGKSFVFDAQKYRGVVLENGEEYPVLLHHGTILVDDSNFHHMPYALKANGEERKMLLSNNFWLRKQRDVKKQELIKVLLRSLPFNSGITRKNFSVNELNNARKLHDEYYGVFEKISEGTRKIGICYKPGSDYDMSKYRTLEVGA